MIFNRFPRNIFKKSKKTAAPPPGLSETWVQGEINWPRLATAGFCASSPFKLARTTSKSRAVGGRFRVTGTIAYPEEVPWSAKPWHIPKDLVHEPLMSFTAARDLTPFFTPRQPAPLFSQRL